MGGIAQVFSFILLRFSSRFCSLFRFPFADALGTTSVFALVVIPTRNLELLTCPTFCDAGFVHGYTLPDSVWEVNVFNLFLFPVGPTQSALDLDQTARAHGIFTRLPIDPGTDVSCRPKLPVFGGPKPFRALIHNTIMVDVKLSVPLPNVSGTGGGHFNRLGDGGFFGHGKNIAQIETLSTNLIRLS